VSKLGNQLARQEIEEVSRGIRLLLARPLLTAEHDTDGFDLVRRRRDPIAKWFDYHCGWRLFVEPRAGYARLSKITRRPDATRPARRLRSSKAPFDRRRYTLLCVVAAELLSGPVTTIGLLADRVVQASATDPDLQSFDPTRRDERSAYVDVLKFLERHGAVRPVDGSTESYLDHADAKVLYQVDTTLLVRLLAAPVPPSTANSIADMTIERRYGDENASETQRNLLLRHSIMRRLMDDPVVYRADLTPAQLGYLSSPTGRRIVHQGITQAGCVLEERAEGFLVIDADGLATDMKFPDDSGHAKVAALVMLDRLTSDGGLVPLEELTGEAEGLLTRFRNWAKAYQSEGGARRLAEDGIDVLVAFGLAERTDVAIRALPAASRYTVERIGMREE
jgi:uncharacterized protein (TIGR02678 family)